MKETRMNFKTLINDIEFQIFIFKDKLLQEWEISLNDEDIILQQQEGYVTYSPIIPAIKSKVLKFVTFATRFQKSKKKHSFLKYLIH